MPKYAAERSRESENVRTFFDLTLPTAFSNLPSRFLSSLKLKEPIASPRMCLINTYRVWFTFFESHTETMQERMGKHDRPSHHQHRDSLKFQGPTAVPVNILNIPYLSSQLGCFLLVKLWLFRTRYTISRGIESNRDYLSHHDSKTQMKQLIYTWVLVSEPDAVVVGSLQAFLYLSIVPLTLQHVD